MEKVTITTFLCFILLGLSAQNLIVHKNEGVQETFPVSTIDSITFVGANNQAQVSASDFKVTSQKYLCTDDLVAAVQAEFGSDWTVADWEHVKLLSSGDYGNIDMNKGDEFLILNDGQKYYSGARHFFIAKHEGQVPDGFLVHDEVGNNYFSLGSWSDITMRILCVNTSVNAQQSMRVSQKNGTVTDYPITEIRKLTFTGGLTATREQVEMIQEAMIRLKAYPNPARDYVIVDYELSSGGSVEIEIYTMKGKQVLKKKVGKLSPGKHNYRWSASQYPAGQYIFRIRQNNRLASEKLIVNK